jgi:hypothetical protein
LELKSDNEELKACGISSNEKLVLTETVLASVKHTGEYYELGLKELKFENSTLLVQADLLTKQVLLY